MKVGFFLMPVLRRLGRPWAASPAPLKVEEGWQLPQAGRGWGTAAESTLTQTAVICAVPRPQVLGGAVPAGARCGAPGRAATWEEEQKGFALAVWLAGVAQPLASTHTFIVISPKQSWAARHVSTPSRKKGRFGFYLLFLLRGEGRVGSKLIA